MELDDKLYNEIIILSESGNDLMEKGEYDKALLVFNKALELIPKPRENYEAGSWIQAAIGDAFFHKDEFSDALDAFLLALKYSEDFSNGFLQLRIGQCFFQLKNKKKAKEHLGNAYMLEGEDIFEYDDEDYLIFLEQTW